MITWNISPEIFSIGPVPIRWYGLLFALSFVIGFQIMRKIFLKEKKSENDLNDLVLYMIIGTVVGARLGHCFFYNPMYYLANPLEIFKTWQGGLASHGAAIGIFLALYFFVKRKKNFTYLWIIDRIVITVALAGFFIRMGNLFNSEIIGTPTDLPWGFVFVSYDDIARHPSQLYEALAYLAIFIFLYNYYKKHNGEFKNGIILGFFLVSIFTFRFFVEFVKENQTYFEKDLALNMGQILSIPLIVTGLYLIFKSSSDPSKKVIQT